MANRSSVAREPASLAERARGQLAGVLGDERVARIGARRELIGLAVTAIIATAVYLFTAERDPQPLDYFNRLADAFLHGRIWVDEAPSWLNELIPAGPGQWYVPYPPVPAVLAMPFVAVFGREFPSQVYSSLYAGLAVGLVYVVLGRLGVGLRLRDRVGLTAVFAFGTVFWFTSIGGSAWYFAHVAAVLLFLGSVLAALDRRPAWVAGLLLGLAALARLPVGLAAPFVLAALLGFPGLRGLDPGPAIRRTIGFAIGLAGPAAVYVAYNLVRWGTITDEGYVRIPGVLEDPIYADHGILSIWYVPRNLFAILFRSWNYVDQPPWLQPSWWGLGIFLTTPLLLWLFHARLRDPRVAWALLAIALVSIPILTHGNVGITQFGYRFSLDFQVLLFVILSTVIAARGWTRLSIAAAMASIGFCAYAVWAIGIDFVDF